MGRTLANTMVNLGIVTSVDEALYQVGYDFVNNFLSHLCTLLTFICLLLLNGGRAIFLVFLLVYIEIQALISRLLLIISITYYTDP